MEEGQPSWPYKEGWISPRVYMGKGRRPTRIVACLAESPGLTTFIFPRTRNPIFAFYIEEGKLYS